MYHIPKDKRSYRSADLICEGLSDKLHKISYDKISITSICISTGIARSTFYRLFDTLDDVLLYQFDSMFDESIRMYSDSKEPLTRIVLRVAMQNQSLVTLLINSGRDDLFNFSTGSRKTDILRSLNLTVSETDWVYCTAILNHMLYGILDAWVRSGCKENENELYDILEKNTKMICNHILDLPVGIYAGTQPD